MYEFFPPKAYALHLPVSAVFIFLAAPLIYAGLNAMTVVPKVNSMDTLQDVHTWPQAAIHSCGSNHQKNAPEGALRVLASPVSLKLHPDLR